MTKLTFFQLDVFTDKAFSGNPLAVFLDGDGLEPERMQAIAREMNLSETVFVQTPTDERALRRLRIFTPARELPMAGHPVIGTWNLLAREEAGNVIAPQTANQESVVVLQEIGLGVLPVEIEFANGKPSRVMMTQGDFSCADANTDDEAIVASLGLRIEDLDSRLTVQSISTGLRFLAVPVKSLDALAQCQIETTRLSALYRAHAATGCLVFTARGTLDGGESRAHARMFAPDENIIEDAATGSACGALGAYLVHHKAIEVQDGQARFVIEQGDFMKRSSRIELEVTTKDKTTEKLEIERVRVGGASVIVARGELMF